VVVALVVNQNAAKPTTTATKCALGMRQTMGFPSRSPMRTNRPSLSQLDLLAAAAFRRLTT
jgi:hypothetical protein